MKTIYRIALLVMMWGWNVPTVNAQENLLKNGGFEEWEGTGSSAGPKDWKIAPQVSGVKSVDGKRYGGKGTKIFMAYLSGGGSISQNDIKVKNGESITLTLWHLMKDDDNKKFNVVFNFYKDDEWMGDEWLKFTAKKETWQEFSSSIQVPQGKDINKAVMAIRFPRSKDGEIYLDDISLIKSGGGGTTTPDIPKPKPEKPQNIKTESFQREITVSWKKHDAEGVAYEVKVGEKTYPGITENSFTVERLEPDRAYDIEVCAVKDGVKSDYEKKSVKTKALEKTVDSKDRIPYLRTVEPASSCKGRFLKLYYNDLANPDAKISYKLDGKPVQPKDNTLEFPAFEGHYKSFRLEIHINEGGGREWEILYNELSVQNFKNKDTIKLFTNL
ncbi:fibronectin type III domain-containing protein [Bacteroides pyogenes]|uniref:Fibronectin type III domain-containing protein n=1 Tax=Bacteroides pyogenes TaxID=310300 RepID=A0A5D3EF14_9BACE|nr:fibronectin type III domain-containing protein [Bacteroides pyogenes]TYK33625.1 fibronectin type III domain-containing protein [Bacteroides pyogenes]TYK48898.1 fibronectin type III domain-containing protein [Bacteroides pyogenes]